MSIVPRVGLKAIFNAKKPLIRNLHCLPFPGMPACSDQSMSEIIDRATSDAVDYAERGMDGLMIENHGDIPFHKPEDVGRGQ